MNKLIADTFELILTLISILFFFGLIAFVIDGLNGSQPAMTFGIAFVAFLIYILFVGFAALIISINNTLISINSAVLDINKSRSLSDAGREESIAKNLAHAKEAIFDESVEEGSLSEHDLLLAKLGIKYDGKFYSHNNAKYWNLDAAIKAAKE